jgi:isopentenyl-diphosphate delta-isomerase
MEEVILVNEKDEPIGTMEKLAAHQKGALHRAFSVFLFNTKGELLLQQRALDKYHSAGLWTNTCCSHPRPGEETSAAAHRRLKEEMGMEADLRFMTSFQYRSEFENGLTEHEFDHVFIGTTDAQPLPNAVEVYSFRWLRPEDIQKEMAATPAEFTTWFRIAMQNFFSTT